MLCGELGGGIHPHLNLTSTRSPYSTLLNLYNTDPSPSDDDQEEDYTVEFKATDYQIEEMNDDTLNSNTETALYDQESAQELSKIDEASITSKTGQHFYASLDSGLTGVGINSDPVIHFNTENNQQSRKICIDLDNKRNGNLNRDIVLTANSNSIHRAKPDLIPLHFSYVERDWNKEENASPDDSANKSPSQSDSMLWKDTPNNEQLPPGWEKHQDNDGPYYWHIKSGTIQRNPPKFDEDNNTDPKTLAMTNLHLNGSAMGLARSNTSSAIAKELDWRRNGNQKEETALKRRSFPVFMDPGRDKAIRFAVRSLGWVDISVSDLTPEKSSKAVNRCIVELSLGKNGLIDNVGRWGDGKDLFMDLDEGALKLIDPDNLTVLNIQPIHTIRVWGVGRDNGRDFAYVARDKSSRKHKCHVFRCDMPARTIANTLRDICKKIMIERSLQQNLAKPVDTSEQFNTYSGIYSGSAQRSYAARPTFLPTELRIPSLRTQPAPLAHSFPTPMEEPKKNLRAQYLGQTEVAKGSGIDMVNDAIDLLMSRVPKCLWQKVDVAVAPSMITISPWNDKENPIFEGRVRYLSFLGIGHDVKQCAFIMHTAQDLFTAHVFHCEPSSGALCKTIEAACKLRYQKCLDAHPENARNGKIKIPSRDFAATLKSFESPAFAEEGW